MCKPFSPEYVRDKIKEQVPSFVINCVNNLLLKKYNTDTRTAFISLNDIVDEIEMDSSFRSSFLWCEKEEIGSKKWFDFEFIYQECGWIVERKYDDCFLYWKFSDSNY